MGSRNRFIISLISATVLLGCNVYDGGLLDSSPAGLPGRPPGSTSSTGDSVEAIFAFRNISLNQSDGRWRNIGLDLDGLNTSTSSAASECVSPGDSLDGTRGIDNTLGNSILPLVTSTLVCLEDEIALNQGLGLGTVLLRIRNWNGQQDDASIDVAILSAVDGTSFDGDPSTLQFGGAEGASLLLPDSMIEAPPPAWDGNDVYYASPADFVGGSEDAPVVGQANTYISAGRVVVPVSTAATFFFLTGVGYFPISVDGFLLADISEDGTAMEKGMLAGRFSAANMIGTLAPLGFCDEGIREALAVQLTGDLDVLTIPDGASPDQACDAISVGFSFEGVRASVGGIAPVALPLPDACGAGATPGNLCCKTVEANPMASLPPGCDLSPYEAIPNPIPVPIQEGFEP